MARITVVGLGPGDFGLLTLASWEAMQGASPLLLRTAIHPTAEELQRRDVPFTSYDARYEAATDFASLYDFIADDLLARAKEADNLVYAVPGSPFVAERTVQLLRQRAEGAGVKLRVLPGMSFAELFCSRLGLDPVDGLTIVDAGDIARLPVDLPTGCIVTQVYSPAVASETKLTLMERFPDEYEIVYAHHLGLPEESIRRLPLYELDRQTDIDHLTSLYLPPRPWASAFDFSPLTGIMKRLREPGGCPWDREQTPASLRPHILEEANRKFSRRFRYVEEQVRKEGGDWQKFTLEALDKFWKQAKFKESQ